MSKFISIVVLLVALVIAAENVRGDGGQPPASYGGTSSVPTWLYPYLKGNDGRAGRDGEKGMKGEKGGKGVKGPPGPPSPYVGYPGMNGTDGIKGMKGYKGDRGERGFVGPQGASGQNGQIITGGGSTYINWGRDDCPSPGVLVYAGRAVAPKFNNAGGGAEYLCLHEVDSGSVLVTSTSQPRSTLVGVHFETYADPSEFGVGGQPAPADEEPLHDFDGHVVVCAVCQIDSTDVYMIPNSQECPMDSIAIDWTTQYTGFLMAARDYIDINNIEQGPVFGNTDESFPPHFRTEYICANMNPVGGAGSVSADPTEALLAHTRAQCNANQPGLNQLLCLPFYIINDFNPCDPNTHCTIGPLGCSVCAAKDNM